MGMEGFQKQGQGVIAPSIHTAVIKKHLLFHKANCHAQAHRLAHTSANWTKNAGSAPEPQLETIPRCKQGLVLSVIPPLHGLASPPGRCQMRTRSSLCPV